MPSNAVILLSGGLDSATTLAIASSRGHRCYALSFDYGQRQRVELQAASRLALWAHAAEHRVAKVDLGSLGGSALTSDIPVPTHRDVDAATDIPVTYVPARNTVFLSYALAFAEVVSARHIFIGVNALDYSGYPDCRPAFVEAFEKLANLATRAGVEGHKMTIEAPLIQLTKAQIIQQAVELGVPLKETHSCYAPKGDLACGVCDACILRRRGFAQANVADPTRYIGDAHV